MASINTHHVRGSIESLIDNWKANHLLLTATTSISLLAAYTVPTFLTHTALLLNSSAIAVFGLALTARQVAPYFPEKWKQTIRYIGVADIELYSLILFTLSKFTVTPVSNTQNKTPILFLHGMLGHGKTGGWLLDQLKYHAPVFQIDMGTDLASTIDIGYEQEIKRCASEVQKKINAILEETHATKIILIGHSRGGVIANYLVTSTETAAHITQVYTICSPQTAPIKETASLASNQKARFMHALLEKIKRATNVRFVQFVSTVDLITSKDQLLTSQETQAYPHIQVKEFDTFGHVGGAFSEEILHEIVNGISSVKLD